MNRVGNDMAGIIDQYKVVLAKQAESLNKRG